MGNGIFWAGLDLGLRQTHVCIVDDTGEPKHEVACETTVDAITEALSVVPKEQIALIAVEAGCDTYAVRMIREANFPITLFESRKASKFLSVRRNKTDKSDARGLADLARIGRHTVSQVHLRSSGLRANSRQISHEAKACENASVRGSGSSRAIGPLRRAP